MPTRSSAAAQRNTTAVALHDAAGYVPDPDRLRARAQRYRGLAESLFDLRTIAIVLDCARELDEQADELIEGRSSPNDLSD